MPNSAFSGQSLTTPISLFNGGTGVSLIDPNADRLLFWDDSAGAFAFLTIGSGLSISETTLSVTTTTSPGGSNTQVQFNDSGSFGGDAGLTYNKTTDSLIITSISATSLAVGPNGVTNPSFVINIADSEAETFNNTGISIFPSADSGVSLFTISPNSNEDLTIGPKGSAGVLHLANTSGQIIQFGTSGSTGGFYGSYKSTNAFLIGQNGSSNPVFQVDTSTTSQVTGIKVKGNIAASGVAISVISSGTDENLNINAKGAGTISLNSLVINSSSVITTGTWNGTTLAVGYGGTGQTSYTDGQLLIGNSTGNTLTKSALTGTSNQITVTNGGGSITLSTPQDIATGSSPTFVGQTLSGNETIAGYLRIGSNSAPTNTTAGDLTVVRLKIGDAAFQTGCEFDLTGDANFRGSIGITPASGAGIANNAISGNSWSITVDSANSNNLTFWEKTVSTTTGRLLLSHTGVLSPVTSDGSALGSGSLMWSDLFLASGAVINFNNGNVTLTHSAGVLTLSDAVDLALGSTTGTKIGTATTQKLSFYNATPIVRPSAYTQTYSTADKTHANPTSTTLTSNGVSVDNTLADVTTTGLADPIKVNANFDDVADEVNKLIADIADIKQLVNSVIDDLQALGLVG